LLDRVSEREKLRIAAAYYVPQVVTPLGSQAKLPGLRKSNSFKKLSAALKPVSETSDCKGCDRLLIDCVMPQDLKPA